jgi:hypothetical protein
MRKLLLFLLAIGMAIAGTSCGSNSSKPSEASKPEPAEAKPAAPAVPEDVQKAAEAALGSETDVLLFGDLAKNGNQEAMAVNRLKATPQTSAVGTLVTRAVVIENDSGKWKELFRCDEHLKNTNGYLAGTPLAGVNGWRLQYEQEADKGLEMYFTPIAKPAGGYIQTIEVRWNPKVKRYQSLDRNFQNFAGEAPALETPQSELR